jgi:aspartyl-tRNA(Asn)/glutamyl-tRNA(Gln) amidotransferase subunit B
MRTKEDAEDYRYFPEPDLLPLVLRQEDIDAEYELLPELPLEKERRFVREFGLSAGQSYFLTSDKKIATYFEEVLKTCPHPKSVANWIAVEFTGRLKEHGKAIWQSGINPIFVAELVSMIQDGTITGKTAKTVADEMVARPEISPRHIVDNNPSLRPFQDLGRLGAIVEEVVQQNEPTVKEFLAGRDRSFAFLVGQVMKKTQGSAPPDLVNKLLRETIEKIK